MNLKYKVLEWEKRGTIKNDAYTVYLIEDSWDDWFQYTTTYNLYVIDAEEKQYFIGRVKIAKFNMPKDMSRPDIPKEFSLLPEEFFSVGQDSYYYENIKNLGDDFRINILKQLKDIAFDKNLFREAYKQDVTKNSLLRDIGKDTVENQFRRIANGGARLTEYKFIYKNFNESLNDFDMKLEFNVEPGSYPPSNIHVLIGRNGVGKTRLINNMIKAILSPNSNNVNELKFENTDSKDCTFSKVIFSSFSAFDDEQIKSRSVKYSRIGLPSNRKNKNDENLIEPNDIKNSKLANEFVDGFEKCIYNKPKKLLEKSLAILGSDPIFKNINFEDYCNEDYCNKSKFTVDDKYKLKKVFQRLSSGHKIIIFTITQLISKVQEKTLVFLDEPEGHLHPPLLSAFVRALSELLLELNGVAIIATHSPVILQEVPQNCVWKLIRYGSNSVCERPLVETFGQDILSLNRDVFGLEIDKSGFHKLLEDIVNEDSDSDYDDIMRKLHFQLGSEGRILLKTLLMTREQYKNNNG